MPFITVIYFSFFYFRIVITQSSSFTKESEKMDQDIKIESLDCLAELKEEITIKEELFETNMNNVVNRNFEDISKPKPRLLENSIMANNVHGDSFKGKNIDIIKTEIKTESNEDYEIDLKSEILAVSCDLKLERQEGTTGYLIAKRDK